MHLFFNYQISGQIPSGNNISGSIDCPASSINICVNVPLLHPIIYSKPAVPSVEITIRNFNISFFLINLVSTKYLLIS